MSALGKIKENFPDLPIFEKSGRRVFVEVSPGRAKELARFVYNELGARFSTASGLDTRAGVEILYHLAIDREGLLVSLRVLVPKPELKMQSFFDIMPAVEWVEREIHEMLGVDFTGHPNLKRLLLPDDWPEGVYPFRKKTFESEKEVTEK
ncbi:MAG TPA: NADH-quinone oxidoreductase subunit C [Candidatus Omnitrophota bacterium]|nr:NADH-quinone oxidoreductase subunit C [Candidatus Omnitrophota bacterium]